MLEASSKVEDWRPEKMESWELDSIDRWNRRKKLVNRDGIVLRIDARWGG